MQDVFRLYAFALVIQTCIFIVYIIMGQPFQPSWSSIIRQVANTAVHAAPPGLPACWLVAGAASRRYRPPCPVTPSLPRPPALLMPGSSSPVTLVILCAYPSPSVSPHAWQPLC